jgi:hypothetical protein
MNQDELLDNDRNINLNDFFIENPHLIKKMATNLCCGRSGSYLFCSMFDGHPDVLSFPPHSYASLPFNIKNRFLPFFYEYTVEYAAKALMDFVPTATIEGNNKDPYSLINAPGSFLAQIGESKELILGVPENGLFNNLCRIIHHIREKKIPNSVAVFINALHIAYTVAGGRKIRSREPLIFLSLHGRTNQMIELLNNEYEQFHCFLSVRHPTLAADSHFVHHLFENICGSSLELAPILLNHYKMDSQQLFDHLGKSLVIAVRFEDLHNNTEKLMPRLCEMLKITWDDALLNSTLDGKTMWIKRGDKLYTGTGHGGVKIEFNSSSKLKVLGLREVYFIQKLIRPCYRDWGYSLYQFSFFQKLLFFILSTIFPPFWIKMIKMDMRELLKKLANPNISYSKKRKAFLLFFKQALHFRGVLRKIKKADVHGPAPLVKIQLY